VRPIGAANGAAHPPDIAVELEDSPAARAVVQTIHVLGDEGKPRFAGFQLRQGEVRRVGRGLGDQLTPPVVPLPHQARVARKSFGRGQIFGPVILPQAGVPSGSAAKSGDAAFRGNARAGEHCHGGRLGQPFTSLPDHFGLDTVSPTLAGAGPVNLPTADASSTSVMTIEPTESSMLRITLPVPGSRTSRTLRRMSS